ncbi:MAG: TonB-dependent receptor, partial [Verrucomicrobia bacterium]|nr:TonB-dependent receptor [Cytophagales bacterium]
RAGIGYQNYKLSFSYNPSIGQKFDFGLEAVAYTVKQGKLQPGAESDVRAFALPDEKSREMAGFIDYEWKISSRISLAAGLRYSFFQLLGPGQVFTYATGEPKSPQTITDTVSYTKNQQISQYGGLEPRLAFNLRLTETSAFKLSYNRMRQYLHLVSNTTAITPIDLWKNSNTYLPPQIGDQLAIGYFKNLKDNTYELSVEIYYKKLQNIVEYKDGADLFLSDANPVVEDDLISGEARAYGAEILARKNKGKLTGWLSYTYSRALRTTTGLNFTENINFGKEYPANFDTPHTVRIVGLWQITPRTTFGSNFLYNTGRPITYPVSRFTVNGGVVVPVFLGRNQQRIPDYHRLDISFTFDGKIKKDRRWQSSWVMGIYNIYARKNAYSIFFKTRNLIPQSYRLAVLGSALPYLTYNFKF